LGGSGGAGAQGGNLAIGYGAASCGPRGNPRSSKRSSSQGCRRGGMLTDSRDSVEPPSADLSSLGHPASVDGASKDGGACLVGAVTECVPTKAVVPRN
jgi:hypothetical protein